MARVKEVIIEKFIDEDWVKTKIKHLVVGDTFRMWMYVDDDWELYEKDGMCEFETISNPFLHPELGIWTVHVDEGLFGEGKKDENITE